MDNLLFKVLGTVLLGTLGGIGLASGFDAWKAIKNKATEISVSQKNKVYLEQLQSKTVGIKETLEEVFEIIPAKGGKN
jgi:hypothetical protein